MMSLTWWIGVLIVIGIVVIVGAVGRFRKTSPPYRSAIIGGIITDVARFLWLIIVQIVALLVITLIGVVVSYLLSRWGIANIDPAPLVIAAAVGELTLELRRKGGP